MKNSFELDFEMEQLIKQQFPNGFDSTNADLVAKKMFYSWKFLTLEASKGMKDPEKERFYFDVHRMMKFFDAELGSICHKGFIEP